MSYHVLFDEGINNFPMSDNCVNVQHLKRINNVKPLPKEQNIVPVSQFELYIIPFTDLLSVVLKYTPSSADTNFGFTFQNYYHLKIAFLKTIKPKYTSSKIFYNPRSNNNKLGGNFVTSIICACVFTSDDDLKQLLLLQKKGLK